MSESPRMFNKKRCLLLIPLLLVVLLSLRLIQAQTAPSKSPRELRNVSYIPDGAEHQKLDLYLPPPDGKTHPLVVWIHGGGWQVGSRYPCPIKPLTDHGCVVASVGYRFSQEAIFPAQIQDCKAAIRWLRAHAAEHGIDPARVGVSGESAGGHLVALLGTTSNIRTFDVGENLDQSSAVQCVIDLFGPADFLHWGDNTDPKLDNDTNGLARLIGGRLGTHQEAARVASPIVYVTKDAAPFLIFHGDKDSLVPLQQSQVLDDALRKVGVESKLIILPGAGHGGPPFGAPENLKAMGEFLEKHLHPNASTPR